jgi:hypothetical protein
MAGDAMNAGTILAIDPGPAASGVVVLDADMLVTGPRGPVPAVIEHDPAETVLRIRQRVRDTLRLGRVVVEGWESYAAGPRGRRVCATS